MDRNLQIQIKPFLTALEVSMTENLARLILSLIGGYFYSYKMSVSADSFLYFFKYPFLLSTKKPQRMRYREFDVTNNVNLKEYPS